MLQIHNDTLCANACVSMAARVRAAKIRAQKIWAIGAAPAGVGRHAESKEGIH